MLLMLETGVRKKRVELSERGNKERGHLPYLQTQCYQGHPLEQQEKLYPQGYKKVKGRFREEGEFLGDFMSGNVVTYMLY